MSDLVAQVQQQARACVRLGSPFYGRLLERVADDLLAGGPTTGVVRGYEDLPAEAAVPLRLVGAVHRLALTGAAPDVAAHYPSCGGDGDPDAAWPAVRDVLARDVDAVSSFMASPPQTNEVGRAAALFGGLLAVLGRLAQSNRSPMPVRLFEIGASGGLNLLADHFTYRSMDGDTQGPRSSPVLLDPAWLTRPPGAPASVEVLERVGADLAPVDVTTEDGAARLLSYVWPDQLDRIERLQGAIEVARRHPVELRRASAFELVGHLRPVDDAVTVLWHSVMWQYLDDVEKRSVLDQLAWLGEFTDERKPLVHLAFEPNPGGRGPFLVTATTWPGGHTTTLGHAPPHGVPVTWADATAGTD
ncbi:MAG TPA: DUF2332 domain-containing protein [Actinomycetales bacterium]|jgi:hypothetical protein|nr:DUF2332 domain-containing protein [Actinomycetales bacterium]